MDKTAVLSSKEVVNSTIPLRDSVADLISDDTLPNRSDFIMFCPSIQSGHGFAEAIAALYYLPERFKLKILAANGHDAQPFLGDDDAIKKRIIIESDAGSPESEGFSFFNADAVIQGEAAMAVPDETPRVVLSQKPDSLLERMRGGFIISANSPEALASAVLTLDRA